MIDNTEVKDKIRGLLEEGNNEDALMHFKDYMVQYRSSEGNSRKLTLKHVESMLSLVIRNTSNKIIIQKLNNSMQNIKDVEKL